MVRKMKRNDWSNIEIVAEDPELIRLERWQNYLEPLSEDVVKIRELITRFEVCHFKYLRHLDVIKASVEQLHPKVEVGLIGLRHLRFGAETLEYDRTGRSRLGQRYVEMLRAWLVKDESGADNLKDNAELSQTEIAKWLGEKDPEKERIVRLLLARMTWDWSNYEILQRGGSFRELELQVGRIDICHYAFPDNLERLLPAIGKLEPLPEANFEGCGSLNPAIQANLNQEFLMLNEQLKAASGLIREDRNEAIRSWLRACLAKTIKENLRLTTPVSIPEFEESD